MEETLKRLRIELVILDTKAKHANRYVTEVTKTMHDFVYY